MPPEHPPAAETPVEHEIVRLDYPGAEIRLYVTSHIERRSRAHTCRKEPWTVQWLDEHVRPGDVLYDIGANVGTFTLIAAVARGASVVAFEPGYANFARLCENLSLNGCTDRVIAIPLLLSRESGVVGFVYRSVEPGQSRHQMASAAWTFGSGRKYEHARHATCTIPLDTALEQFKLPPPTHIKLDVDGAERLVLEGAVNTLRRSSLRSVLVEASAELWTDVEALITAAGLQLDTRLMRGDKPSYALFVRPGSPA